MRPPLLQIELNISSAVSNKIAAVCPACENLLFASTESRQIWWGFPHPLLGPLQQACNRGPGFLNPILGITNVKRSTCRPLVCSYFYIFLGSNAHKVSMLSPKHSQSLLYFVPQSSKVRHQLPKQIQLQLRFYYCSCKRIYGERGGWCFVFHLRVCFTSDFYPEYHSILNTLFSVGDDTCEITPL